MVKNYKQFNESHSDQLKMGIKVESEHSNIYDELKKYLDKSVVEMPWTREVFYKKIADAHIKEISDYYDRLLKMEKD